MQLHPPRSAWTRCASERRTLSPLPTLHVRPAEPLVHDVHPELANGHALRVYPSEAIIPT
jgi:hypothetical protein